MFYRASYDQEERELREMNKVEQYNWLIRNLKNPDVRGEINESLSEGDHIKFKSVCALRFIQKLNYR